MQSESNTISDSVGEGQQQGRPTQGRTSGPTRRSTKGQWSAEEDEILRAAVQLFKGKSWKKIGISASLHPLIDTGLDMLGL